MTFELGVSSASAVEVFPEYDYARRLKKIESSHRTLTGALNIYKWSHYSTFGFSVDWVPAADAAIVNSWWVSNTQLLFLITSGGVTEVNSVVLRGDASPLAQYQEPYDNYCRGKILLEGY